MLPRSDVLLFFSSIVNFSMAYFHQFLPLPAKSYRYPDIPQILQPDLDQIVCLHPESASPELLLQGRLSYSIVWMSWHRMNLPHTGYVPSAVYLRLQYGADILSRPVADQGAEHHDVFFHKEARGLHTDHEVLRGQEFRGSLPNLQSGGDDPG